MQKKSSPALPPPAQLSPIATTHHPPISLMICPSSIQSPDLI
jgi:hypothetical protein